MVLIFNLDESVCKTYSKHLNHTPEHFAERWGDFDALFHEGMHQISDSFLDVMHLLRRGPICWRLHLLGQCAVIAIALYEHNQEEHNQDVNTIKM